MWQLGIVCTMLLAATGTSAIKVFGDYEEYSDYKHGEGGSDHWQGLESDHVGKGRGENYHHGHFLDNSGEVLHGDSKAGGHIKHHVTKGYRDFHHKDEVGQLTRYIDGSGDSGDHHGTHSLRNRWGGHASAGVHGDNHKSEFKGEKSAAEKKESKEKKEDYKWKIGDFLYTKKPTSYEKKFYSHVPLQYVPYPHYFY
ncbi:uncharacterized protein LOC129005411 [Macrosteles quadrilineatus]|uniref:uncharacterized protein LOC129005411 n=1 Tax=Macrosteles quadrilineatus TaxID=74068 RepID=UPI0023E32099|nr:uncharacterized protein LOC129005411 [Macrosteles quadrilineatus]